jgi:HAD superfamily phosphoserine phosphatase-like hydrolase
MFIIFDMDGTLTRGDSWVATNEYFGTDNEYIDSYLKGRISYQRYLDLTCEQWIERRGGKVYYEELDEAVRHIAALGELRELLRFARERGWKTGILSAGIDSLSNIFLKEYDFDFAMANGFEYVQNGGKRELTGKGIPRVDLLEKGRIIEEVTKGEPFIALGDTRFDVPMFKRALASIAINPKDRICMENATRVVRADDFGPVIEYLANDLRL